MKSLTLLWQSVAQDCAAQCCTSTIRDEKTVSDRVRKEGVSFLTITLTNFGNDFQKSLDQGFVGSDQFSGFRRAGGLPAFLQGFLRQIFDPKGGRLVHSPSIEAIRAVRQLTLMFGKVLLPCTPSRERKAIEGYVHCEQEIRICDGQRSSEEMSEIRRIWTMLFGNMFSRMDGDIFSSNFDCFMPKHGPGATADRLVGNQKFNQSEWPARLEEVLPFGEFALPNWRYYQSMRDLRFLEPGQERPVRVVLVPKTLKTPRVIAIEPTAMQYAQQSILGYFLQEWKKDDYLSSFLGFDDQIPNQDMARLGSLDGSLATLDLSEASDRVSNQLVRGLMAKFPHIAEAFDATRSRKADVPGYGVLRLAKYASMGSALCFPVEAMVFLTIVFYSIEKSLNRPLTRKDIESYTGRVRIYGDDIIIPVEIVPFVCTYLEAFGFRVNGDKSFWTGKFRESCGKEFYDGHDVSIVRFRRVFPSSRKNVEEVLSLVSFRNQMYWSGFWKTCQRLDEEISNCIRYFPISESTSPVIGRESVLPYEAERTCEKLHRPLVKGYVISARPPVNSIDGPGALVKCLTGGFFEDTSHLERSGRPRRVSMKLSWTTPY